MESGDASRDIQVGFGLIGLTGEGSLSPPSSFGRIAGMSKTEYSIDDLNRLKRVIATAGLIRGFDGQAGWIDLRTVMTAVIDQTISLMSERPDEDVSGPSS